MSNPIAPALSPEQRCDLQREAAKAYDDGRMDDARAALDKLGCANFAQGLAALIDGSILNKHLPPRAS